MSNLPVCSSPKLGGGAWPPYGWVIFWKFHKDFREAHRAAHPMRALWDWEAHKELSVVQYDVNTHLIYRADMAQYRKADHWVVPTRYADCEDYALAKRKVLIEKHHWPRGALRIATCWTERGEYHAVLLVWTMGGVWLLDNRYLSIQPWDRVRYKWHKLEQPGQFRWEKFSVK